ncbi:hypothetical protein F6W69_02785 [Microbacterium oxydans]|uniref:hypothetical protein n=1 Tax=Microbacterium oxydans TaxID=82380 RepID=UPI0011438D0E|nr:hypothetical protein [Microbacterium oxydans]KAB1893001.1 hypothetical protein F6W69_02785 [Microbacterium oxydans]GED37423.1 hypothetical protein MOX01_05650 [Microbacterium oxydans]
MNIVLALMLSAATETNESAVTVWSVLQGAGVAAVITGVFGLLALVVNAIAKHQDAKRQDSKDLEAKRQQDAKDLEDRKLEDARAQAAAAREEERRQADQERDDSLRAAATKREDDLAAKAQQREDDLVAAAEDRRLRDEHHIRAEQAGREMLVALRKVRAQMGKEGPNQVRQEDYMAAADLGLMLPNREAAMYFFIDIQNAYDIIQIGFAEDQQENNGPARWDYLKMVLQRASDYVVAGEWDDEWLTDANKQAKAIEAAWESGDHP